MTGMCKHNVAELLRGSGACDIKAEVKLRNGRPNWWCHTHGLAAGAPDGAPLPSCPGVWLEPIGDDMQLSLDLAEGEVAIWGVVPPAISIGAVPTEAGRVHVHRRSHAGASKDIDRSYDLVRLHRGGVEIAVEGMAAVAYSLSELSGLTMSDLRCPHCGYGHIDEKMFATRGHKKHQCNRCGRNFWDHNPSVGNPLSDAQKVLGLPQADEPAPAARTIELQPTDYTAIALWPSNAAIVTTMSRPEESGIHVHAWAGSRMIVDETFDRVTLRGKDLDLGLLRVLAVQRALADDQNRIASLQCQSCGTSLLSPTAGWMEPTTRHTCGHCGHVTKTRKKVFLNPIATI